MISIGNVQVMLDEPITYVKFNPSCAFTTLIIYKA